MDDFEKELKVGFLEEATHLLVDAEQSFLSLETNPEDAGIVDKIFRLAHNFKGSAKAVGFEQMGAFAHVFESFLLKVKNGEVPKNTEVISLLLRCNDFLKDSVSTLQSNIEASLDGSDLKAELEAGINGKFLQKESSAPAEAPLDMPSAEEAAALMALETEINLQPEIAAMKSTEVSVALAPVVAQEIPFAAPASDPAAIQVATETKQEKPTVDVSKGNNSTKTVVDESIRVSTARLERLINIVGEMVILQTVLREQAYSLDPTLLRRTVHQIGKVTKEIQDISMSLRMVPVKQTFQKMQRIVRDTASLLGKKVNLHLSGEETELDKTVLESISDPLVHLIRNAVDHGIETNEKRLANKKNPEGNVFLGAYQESGRLVIEIRDDGGGIDGAHLLKKAKEKGVISANAVMTEKDSVNLIFHPGFSTKQEVTEVSGRGVGMDVVRTNIERLQGEIQIKTEVGKGTTFRVVLPLTLAIIDGMVVRSGEERFVIPLAQVHESVRPTSKDIQQNVGIGEVLILRGECMPLVRLGHVLGRKDFRPATDSIAIVIRSTEKPFALLVDDIIGQNQIVIKKLGKELEKLKFFSGSAVLGDGRPAFILDPPELAKIAVPFLITPPASKVERVAS